MDKHSKIYDGNHYAVKVTYKLEGICHFPGSRQKLQSSNSKRLLKLSVNATVSNIMFRTGYCHLFGCGQTCVFLCTNRM